MSQCLDILAIDIDAALRKLTEKRFKNRDEPALALIRFVAAASPSAIFVTLKKKQFVLETTSGDFSTELFTWLQILFDPRRKKSERSQTLSLLENRGGLDMLAAFSGKPKLVEFTFSSDSGATCVRFAPGRKPLRITADLSDRSFRMVVHRGMPGLADPEILAEKCRFADIPIFVNEKRVSHGVKVEGSLIRQQLPGTPVEGVIGIPKEGDLSHILLLDNGVISDDLYMPNLRGIVFKAVVFRKRSDFLEFYPMLRQAAKRLLPHLATGYGSLGNSRASQAETRLFDRYEVTNEKSLVTGVTAFKTAKGARIDLPAIERALKKETIYAVEEGKALQNFAVSNRNVLVLSRRQRRFLDAVLDQPLRTPPSHISVGLRSRGLWVRLRDLWKDAAERSKFVDSSAWTDVERHFIGLLREATSGRAVGFSMSFGRRLAVFRLREDGTKCFLVPRNHPAVLEMMERVSSDPQYLSPALSLLTDGEIS